MTTGCDIDWSRSNMNKRVRIPIIKKRDTPPPQNTCDPLLIPDQQ